MPRLSLAPGLLLVTLLAAPLTAQTDGFSRERAGPTGPMKTALEGKLAPAITGKNWVNAPKPPQIASLKGKVVLIDFWGTW